MDDTLETTQSPTLPENTFASRLRQLIGDVSVSAFARKVSLSESLIRKYLKGSEPSLTRADQIARFANVSLEWLATGCGYQYRQAEVVDRQALELANNIIRQCLQEHCEAVSEFDQMAHVVSVYQFLRSHKKSDGYLDAAAAVQFAEHALQNLV